MPVDEARLATFAMKVIGDIGAAASGALVVLGDRLGLYRAMADAGPLTAAELAERTSTDTRCVEEWLRAQAVNGYVDADDAGERFTLSSEQAARVRRRAQPGLLRRQLPDRRLDLRRSAEDRGGVP